MRTSLPSLWQSKSNYIAADYAYMSSQSYRVQDIAQPYFLRRTKEAVLNLPPLSEVILPLSMSPLQKLVYKSVLEKNMDALKAIYDASKAKTKKKVMTGKVYVQRPRGSRHS